MKLDLPEIIIAIDTREPEGAGWEPFFTVPTIRAALTTGDYSLVSCESLVAVERKTIDDLISCFCQSRERFTRELQRFQAIPDRWIICEGNYRSLLEGEYHSRMNARSAWESAIALMTRYRIPLLMSGDTRTAAALCQSLLIRWLKEHARILDQVHGAVRQFKAG